MRLDPDTKIILQWLMLGVISIGGALLIIILANAYG